MAPTKKKDAASTGTTATKQIGLGAFLKKGVNMADFTVPTASAASGSGDKKEKSTPTRASTRKRNASSAATKAADAKPKKPKKAGPSRDHEQLYWDQGKKWAGPSIHTTTFI